MSETERPKPYVGVSGVVNSEQQKRLTELFQETGLIDQDRILALGVKAVHKTQFLDVANKYGAAWYPVGEGAFKSSLVNVNKSDSMGIAQVYLDPSMVDNPGYRDYFSDRILRRGSSWADGIQFDMLPWHSDVAMLPFLEKLKSKHETKLLLQVHGPAMEALGPQGVVQKLAEHAEILDYILFDASHGKGERLDTKKLAAFIKEAYAHTSLGGVGIALAGGLNGTVVKEELPAIISEFPDISWDAEGQLHTLNNNGEKPLNFSVIRDYMEASALVLRDS